MDREAMAKAVGDSMWREDRASKWLGMKMEELKPGYARLSMTVTEQMANGQAMCHGGLIFTLADSSFGFACNSHNQRTVTQHCAITFVAPGKLGDRLIARCIERQRAGRSGIYDATVTREDGAAIAEFRGLTRTIEGKLIEG